MHFGSDACHGCQELSKSRDGDTSLGWLPRWFPWLLVILLSCQLSMWRRWIRIWTMRPLMRCTPQSTQHQPQIGVIQKSRWKSPNLEWISTFLELLTATVHVVRPTNMPRGIVRRTFDFLFSCCQFYISCWRFTKVSSFGVGGTNGHAIFWGEKAGCCWFHPTLSWEALSSGKPAANLVKPFLLFAFGARRHSQMWTSGESSSRRVPRVS